MRLTCPACGAEMTIDVAIAHEGARAATLAALELPAQLGKPLIAYVALFRPPKRQLSHDRLAALLNELLPMIQTAQIERHGRTWPAPVEYWRAAIDEMLAGRDRLTLPLKSHGYLLEIIAAMAGKAEGRAEARIEEERKYAYSGERSFAGAPGPLGHYVQVGGIAPMPEETRQSIDKILGRRNGDAG